MLQTVLKYAYIGNRDIGDYQFIGSSTGSKHLIPQLFPMPNETGLYRCLDVGFGRGELGVLLTEDHPHISIDGIDAWPATCHNPRLADYYKNIWCVQMENLPAVFYEDYDFIFALDILEHFDQVDAYWALYEMLLGMKKTAKLVVSTPLWFYPQGNVEPGDFEKHKCVIPATTFAKLKPEMYNINPQDYVGMFVLNKNSLQHINDFVALPDKSYDKTKAKRVISQLGWNLNDGWQKP